MRWIRGLVPLAAVALMGAAPLARPPILAAADPPWLPPPCPPSGQQVNAAPAGAWYRLDGVQDATGTLIAQHLSIGVVGDQPRIIALPPESFASGPDRGRVLVGEDDGARSRLSLVDPVRGCATTIGGSGDVVRSALLDPDGTAVWEHRVSRATREDLGVWRRPLDGGPVTRRLRGAPADARYGRTYATELRWVPDGAIAVTTCGETACRTRVMDRAGGPVTTVGPTGPVVGVGGGGTVVAHRACGGFPCAIQHHRAGREPTVLVAEAGRAAMAGERLVYELEEGGLGSMDIGEGRASRVTGTDELVPLSGGSRAAAGAERPAGDVLLAPSGRFDGRTLVVLGQGDLAPQAIGGEDR